jgi:hypothetical protein
MLPVSTGICLRRPAMGCLPRICSPSNGIVTLFCLRGNVFTEPLPSNERLRWLHYSGFRVSCHNTVLSSRLMYAGFKIEIYETIICVCSFAWVWSLNSEFVNSIYDALHENIIRRPCDQIKENEAWNTCRPYGRNEKNIQNFSREIWRRENTVKARLK